MRYAYLPTCTAVVRQALGISLEELAEITKKPLGLVLSWETGRRTPSLADLGAMCPHYFEQCDYLPLLGNGRSTLVVEAYGRKNRLSYNPRFTARIREELQISQSRLGLLLRVSGTTIHRWEAGNLQPSLERVAGMAGLYFSGKAEPLSLLTNTSGAVLLRTENNLRL